MITQGVKAEGSEAKAEQRQSTAKAKQSQSKAEGKQTKAHTKTKRYKPTQAIHSTDNAVFKVLRASENRINDTQFPVAIAKRIHLFPSRTQKLSS